MKNAERYTTNVLKEREREILHAEETGINREEALFNGLIQSILEHADALKETAAALAEIDVLIGWGALAREWDYCQPQLDESDQLLIEQGRHPVVEQMMRGERLGLAGTHAFVPNDARLSSSGKIADAPQVALITGPNMAGKSTYIRQTALIVLMAQSGAWVPAKSCCMGLVDRIFSRVGASDELARGNSTFMVEMNETANILNNATPRSLVILDEIGRGTSTYDGLSIAWAVIEHLHPKDADGPRTLFATHYHELTQLAKTLDRVENYSVAVKEWNDEIIFVRQVIQGAADRSYGIQVARLAGLPSSVIDRAKTILERLEADDSSHNLLRKRMKKEQSGENTDHEDDQLALF
jgi:DNA mismatch repair protein MutS